MQYRILAVTIWSSIIGNLEFCTADDLTNKYSGHLTEVQTFDPQKQILDLSLSRRLYFKNDTFYQSTTETIKFELDELSNRSSSIDNVNYNYTTSKNDETNDTNIVDLSFRIPINENHQSAPLSNIHYEISASNNRFKETDNNSAFKIRNNVESAIASGTNERISERVELNDEEKFLESDKNDYFMRDNLPTASSSSSSSSFGKFSGPIIVPDFPQLNTSSSTLMSENLADNRKYNPEIEDVIGSTLVLNPLRVGVALVNDKENTFIDDDSEKNQSVKCVIPTSTVQTEANTLEEENAANNDKSNKFCSNISSNYEQFSKQSESLKFDEHSKNKKKSEGTVEIQKSIEIYHNAPVQEIHYPVELSLPLSSHVENIYKKGKANEPINYDNVQKEFRINGLQDQPIDVKSENSNVYVDHFEGNIEENLSRSRPTNNLLVGNTEGVAKKNINFPYISMGLYLSSDKRTDSNSFPAQHNNNNNGNNIGIPIFLLPGQSQDATTNYEQYTDGGNIFNGISMTTNDGNKHQTPNNLKLDKDDGHHYVENQYEERSDPSQYNLFQRIVQNNPFIETRYVVPVSSPYSIITKKSSEKPVYGVHTTELENLDNKVFYSIEKLTDKQTSSMQQQQIAQVHPQISNEKQTIEKQTRLTDPYTFYIEKTGEKKVPHVIHRLIMQPYPVNMKLPYTSSEKIIPDYSEKKVVNYNRKPYLIETGKHSENIKIHSEDIDKIVSQPIHRSLQKLYAEVTSIPFHKNYINSSSSSSSSIHDNSRKKPNFYFGDNIIGYNNINNNNKNVHYNYLEQPSNSVPSKEIISNGNSRSYRRRARIFDNKDRTPKNKYIDSRQTSSSSLRMQIKSSPFFLLEAQQSIVPGIMRNARQSEGYPLGDIGNFRQSKVEYGFKPPMIPSIQYDEQTASKVDK